MTRLCTQLSRAVGMHSDAASPGAGGWWARRGLAALWPVLARRYARGRGPSSTRRAACARAGAASEAARGRSRCAAGLVERGQVLSGRHRAARPSRCRSHERAYCCDRGAQRSDATMRPTAGATCRLHGRGGAGCQGVRCARSLSPESRGTCIHRLTVARSQQQVSLRNSVKDRQRRVPGSTASSSSADRVKHAKVSLRWKTKELLRVFTV